MLPIGNAGKLRFAGEPVKRGGRTSAARRTIVTTRSLVTCGTLGVMRKVNVEGEVSHEASTLRLHEMLAADEK